MTIPLKHRIDGLGEFQSGDSVPFEHGGTNATSLIQAQENLGIASKAEQADFEALESEVDTKADAIAVNQALALKADLVGGVIPANQLPSFVDDVLEYANLASFPVTGEDGKIYIALDVNKTYRWGGSSYVEIGGGGVALGETSSTAYRGDRGKIAYDHSQSQGNPHNTASSEILLNSVSFANTSKIANGDNLSVVAGKLQAQVDLVAPVTWVDISTLTGYTKNSNVSASGSKVEIAKIGGLIWVRGYITTTNSLSINTELFSWSDANYLWDYVPINSTYSYDTWLNQASIYELAEFKVRIRQNYSGSGSHRLRFFTDQAFSSSIAKGVIPPIPIGKALN